MGDRPTDHATWSFTIGGIYTYVVKERKRKEEYLYSAICILCISQSAQAWITQFYLQIHHACLSFVSVHQMAPPLTEVADIQLQLTTQLVYQPQMDERLSWPGWLTYSERFTHIKRRQSATGQAQDRKVHRPKTDVLPL